ncbi:P-loop containing nucleoside triphosphate hydrolase protein [Pavlovales sp. CCMP2436]|nr:P-loop containing nucleoside triphosphate hydrolase protein [Pavlovales sp. CCMP2436]
MVEHARNVICPITGAAITEPVALDADPRCPPYAYERAALHDWLAASIEKLSADGLALPHDRAGEPILILRDPSEMTFRPVRLPLGADAPPPNARTLCRLGDMFKVLDTASDVLASSFEPASFAPPRILVVGQEKTGKSTLLERLCGLPLFPQDQERCTRMAVHVRLRRCKPSEARTCMSVTEAGRSLGSPTLLPVFMATTEVRALMEKHHEHRITREIVLEVKHPDVPCLDLVDLPGLVMWPEDERVATTAVVRAQLAYSAGVLRGRSVLCLFTHKCSENLDANIAWQIIRDSGNSANALGVFTFCDTLDYAPNNRSLRIVSTDISKRTTARRCSCAQSRSASRKAMGSEPLSRGWCVHMRACAPIVRAPARPLPSPCARRGAARLTAKRALSRRILHGRAAARHVHLGHQEKLAAAHSQTHRECARRIAGRGDRPRHAPSPDGSGVARGDGCAY